MSVAWHSMENFLGTANAAPTTAAVPTNVKGQQAQLPATGRKENAGLALGAAAAGLVGTRLVKGAKRPDTPQPG
jgi:hypothetical protein